MQNETLRTFEFLMGAKGQVQLQAEGFSMYPYIRPGDICCFAPFKDPLKAGRIGLVVSPRGILFSHRLLSAKSSEEGTLYFFRGDLNPHPDEPVTEAQIVGVLTALVRKGKVLDENRLARRFWSALAVRLQYLFRFIAYLSLVIDTDRETTSFHRRRIHGFRNPKG